MTSRAIEALGLTEQQYADLKRMLPARKLEAVKRYREITNFGLAEAKAAIDAIEAGAVPGGGPPVSQRPAWETAAQQGVQATRQQPGASLHEAKAIADLAMRGATDEAGAQLGARWGLDPETATGIARRLRSSRRGPALLLAATAMALAAAIAWFAWNAIRG